MKNEKVDFITILWVAPVLSVCLLLTACSSTPDNVGNAAHGETKPTTVASIEAKQIAAEQQAAYVVEIEFPKNSAKLTKETSGKLNSFYGNIAEPKLLKSAKVIAWADEEYPSKQAKKLNADQTDLAQQRAEAVEKLVKDRNSSLSFEVYNMAKRPGKFGELVGSSDARIKDSLERAGISTTDDRATSKARKVIVMFIVQEGEKKKTD